MKIIAQVNEYIILQIGPTYFVENGGVSLGCTEDLKKAERIFKKALSYANLSYTK